MTDVTPPPVDPAPAPRILVEVGPKIGPGLFANEAEFRAQIAGGFDVFTRMRGVYFTVTLDPGTDKLVYTSLAENPSGL